MPHGSVVPMARTYLTKQQVHAVLNMMAHVVSDPQSTLTNADKVRRLSKYARYLNSFTDNRQRYANAFFVTGRNSDNPDEVSFLYNNTVVGPPRPSTIGTNTSYAIHFAVLRDANGVIRPMTLYKSPPTISNQEPITGEVGAAGAVSERQDSGMAHPANKHNPISRNRLTNGQARFGDAGNGFSPGFDGQRDNDTGGY